jgi:hypothetical protein
LSINKSSIKASEDEHFASLSAGWCVARDGQSGLQSL